MYRRLSDSNRSENEWALQALARLSNESSFEA
jgi:hypothetical protein